MQEMLKYFINVVDVDNNYNHSANHNYETIERIKDDLLSEYGDDIQETRYGFVNKNLSNEELKEIYELENKIHDCVIQEVTLSMLRELKINKQLSQNVKHQIEHAYIDLHAHISHEDVECVGSKTTEIDKEVKELSKRKKYFLKYYLVDDIARLAFYELICRGVISGRPSA